MRRFALFVYVNLDPVPGAFHTGNSALENTRGILINRLGHYEPTVGFAPDNLQPDDGRRLALVVYINLEPIAEHPKHFARDAVRMVLRDMIQHYNPVVTYARRELQPDYTEGIITA